jgi:hypothetical protein
MDGGVNKRGVKGNIAGEGASKEVTSSCVATPSLKDCRRILLRSSKVIDAREGTSSLFCGGNAQKAWV